MALGPLFIMVIEVMPAEQQHASQPIYFDLCQGHNSTCIFDKLGIMDHLHFEIKDAWIFWPFFKLKMFEMK